MGVLDTLRRGMNTAGETIGLPVVSQLLEIPQYIHDQNQKSSVEKAVQQLDQPRERDLSYPTAPVKSPSPAGGQGLGVLASADPPLPANFTPGQPLPRPTGNQIPPGAQVAQGPPLLTTGPSRSKEFLTAVNKIYSPDALVHLQKTDPKQYAKVMAYRGIANFDQGNAQGAVADLVEAGLPAGDAIGIMQEMKNQKAMGQFSQTLQGLLKGSGSSPGVEPGPNVMVPPQQVSPSGASASGAKGVLTGSPSQGGSPVPTARDGMPLTKQEFMQKALKAMGTLPGAQRNAAFQQVQQIASTLPDRKELGPLRAQQQLPEFERGLAKAKTPQEVQALVASQVQSLPAPARGPFLGLIKSRLQNWQQGFATQQKESTLSGPALDLAAKQYLATGTMPSFGMQGQKQKEAVMNRAAEMQKAEGLTPDDAVFNQNEIKAGRQALGQIAKSQGMIMQYEDTAYKNADLALKAMEKADGTGVPVFNRWLMAGRSAVGGDAAVARFNAANQTFVNEYAKVMSGGYGASATSDSARQEALSVLNTAQTPEQYRAVVDQLKKEMNNRMEAMRHTRTFLETQIRQAISGKKDKPQSGSLPQGAVPGSFRGQKGYLLNGRFYAEASK
ncbi:MAG: hypothetical protein ACYCR5_04475 [Leptospirillum sp.]